MAKSAVFLDTSIFITALLSSQGGSFYLLNTYKDRVNLQTNDYVLQEINDVLQNKFPDRNDMRIKLFLILGTANITILQNPPKKEIEALKKFISKKDAPILASAIKNSNYLITLDNEFFKHQVNELATAKKLTILKPKGLIEYLRRS